MTPVFPLGVKKDMGKPPGRRGSRRRFDPEQVRRVVGGPARQPPRFCQRFPRGTSAADIALKLAGAGATARRRPPCSSRAPPSTRASTRRTSRATARSRGEAPPTPTCTWRRTRCSRPRLRRPHAAGGLQRSQPGEVRAGGDGGGSVRLRPLGDRGTAGLPPGVRLLGHPVTRRGPEPRTPMVKNVVALGALQAATGLFPWRRSSPPSARRWRTNARWRP